MFIIISYAFVLFLCGLSLNTSIFINSVLIVYTLNQYCYNRLAKIKPYLVFISIGNYVTFQVMVASYAELLEWENALIVLFYLQTFYYYYHSIVDNKRENEKILK